MQQFRNMHETSHLIKDYLQCHRNVKMELMEVGMKVKSSFKSAISRVEKEGTKIMNSKAEFNRFKLPRLNTQCIDDQLKEIEEEKKREKSQNCFKAAIAFVCTTCKRQLLFALLQKITFVCTIAKDNFCLHFCN